MSLLEFLSVSTALLFGIIAIIISIKDDRSKKSETEKANLLPYGQEAKKQVPRDIKDDFTNIAVHELRSPLTSIKDSSELLLNHKYTLAEDEKEQFLKMINRQSHLLLDQVGSILDIAKLESGTFSLNKKPDTMDELIYERIKIFAPQAERKNIFLTCNVGDHLPIVDIDKVRMGQALNNLISNSIKFTPEGGKIIVSASTLFNKGVQELRVSVADTGRGIPKEDQSKIFTKFYQVRGKDGKEERDGSGLGLYITKKIIDAHGGSISLDSDEGRGTIITLTLPAYKLEQTETTSRSPDVAEVNPDSIVVNPLAN